jgi:hypothetical protein
MRLGLELEERVKPQSIVSSWNHTEAAMMLALQMPIMICVEQGVDDGIFRPGSGLAKGCFLYNMPERGAVGDDWEVVFQQWSRAVREHYDQANAKFDVFLSFSGEDEADARRVFDYLAFHGLRVFFSKSSIPQLAQADYMKAINRALDGSRHLIVLSRTREGFAKPWVEREWMMFLNEKLCGRKSGNIVVINAGGVEVADLPIALRSQQVVALSESGLAEALLFMHAKGT